MNTARRYGTYDAFAWYYIQGWADGFHAEARPVLEKHVFPLLRQGAPVLDLCCGAGHLSRLLVAHGYRVTGIDGSEEMLRFARGLAPEAEFRCEDAREFHFEPAFDAVLCTFDSLNHVLNLAELEAVFANVHRALKPGGVFFFDLNMADAFEALWRGAHASVNETAAAITAGSYDPVEKIGRADVTLFRLEDTWKRSDVTVLEKCYTVEEAAAALERAGMTEVRSHEACELGMRGDIALGRRFFFARRPSE